MIRDEILVSRQDRGCLDLLVAGGLLDSAEVERAIRFLEEVLRHFDNWVTEAME